MRGKRALPLFATYARRITPADAGKTYKLKDWKFFFQDHPRGCGENTDLTQQYGPAPGSPPRMRGKPTLAVLLARLPRITPADAGKTLLGLFIDLKFWDHPRGCGENYDLIESGFANNGITPADAGKTAQTRINNGFLKDHPRGCGENALKKFLVQQGEGSPPRMRGKLAVCRGDSVFNRITPADAGKTYAAEGVPLKI